MNASNVHRSFLGQIAERWVEFREHQADREFLGHMSQFELDQLAADVGVSGSELADAIQSGANADQLLDRMLEARGLSRDEIAAREPGAIREIESMCSRCEHKNRCAQELEAGTALRNAEQFCPNALAMAALGAEFGKRPARADA